MTLSDCYKSPDRIEIKHQQLQKKLIDANYKMQITSRLNDNDTEPYDR